MFDGGIVKENGEFENMNEVVELFDAPPTFKDLVDRAMRKYGCRVDEITLRGRFDYGKARPHYVVMNLALESNWKQYKMVVEHANVVCLEVIVEIFCILGRMDKYFSYTHNKLRLLKECDVKLPFVPNAKDISMVHKAICESTMVNFEGIPFSKSPVIKKRMKFNSLEKLKFFLVDYAVRLHRSFSVVHSNKNLRYDVMCKQGCLWHVWSWIIRSTRQWRISKVVQPYTCHSSQPKGVHSQCTAKYLGQGILRIVRVDSETSMLSLVESIFAFIGYCQVFKGMVGETTRHCPALGRVPWHGS